MEEILVVVWNGTMERAGTAPRLSEWPDDWAALARGQLRPDFYWRAKAAGEVKRAA